MVFRRATPFTEFENFQNEGVFAHIFVFVELLDSNSVYLCSPLM